jgi:hypothetical protein
MIRSDDVGSPFIYRLISNHPVIRQYCPRVNSATMLNITPAQRDAHIATIRLKVPTDIPSFSADIYYELHKKYNIPHDKLAQILSTSNASIDRHTFIRMDGIRASTIPISEEEFAIFKRESEVFWRTKHKKTFMVTQFDKNEYCKTNCCNYCGNPATLTCQKCLQVKYCSKDCQRLDWPTHRGVCRAPASAPAAPAAPAAPSAAAPSAASVSASAAPLAPAPPSLRPIPVNNSAPVLSSAPAPAPAPVRAPVRTPLLMIENAPRLLMIQNGPAPVPVPVPVPASVLARTVPGPAPGTARPRPPPPKGYKGKGGKKTRRRRNIKRRISVSKR